MIAADALAAYRKNEVTTASPQRLVLMLYDEAIRSLKWGNGAIERHDIQATSDNLNRAQQIITTLLGALDRDAGGSLADNLAALYNYILRLVARANVEKNTRPLQEAIGLMNTLRTGWQGALLPGQSRSEAG